MAGSGLSRCPSSGPHWTLCGILTMRGILIEAAAFALAALIAFGLAVAEHP